MPVPLPDPPAVEMAIIEMTNVYRAQMKLAGVTPSPALSKAAREYAAYIARSGTFSHDADGRQVGDRVKAQGYTWCSVAENLAMHLDSRGFESRDLAKKSVEGWINSPSHRAALVAPHATEVGVGVARVPDKNPKYVTVQVFARPESLTYEFQISNASKTVVTYTFDGESHSVEPSTGITHSACTPGTIEFQKAGAKRLSARYEATDGMVYTLSPDGTSGVRVDAKPLARLE